MTFLAHWKMGGTPGYSMDGLAAVDSQAGGSGAHNGIYRLASGGALLPYGYDQDLSLQGSSSASSGIIDSIANISDLQLTGTMTVMFWFNRYALTALGTIWVINVGGATESEADNHTILISIVSGFVVRCLWEYGASGTNVTVNSSGGILDKARWQHVAVVRYPISANYGVKFYVDGVLADTQDSGGTGFTAPSGGTNGAGYIGRTATSATSYSSHGIGSIRVYDTDESANVSTVYNAEKDSFTAAEGLWIASPIYPYGGIAQILPAYTGPELLLEGNTNAGFHR